VRVAILIAFFSFTSAYAEIVDHVAAAVDDEVITVSDLDWLVRYRNLEVPTDPQQRRSFYMTLLDQVIDQKLIAHEAEQTPIIQVTSEKIDAQIAAYRSRFPSEEAYQQKLSDMEISTGEFRELIRRQLAVNEFIEARFKPFVIVLPTEIEQYYEAEFVPELKRAGQPIPALEVVEESIRQILTEQKTNQELDRWLRSARRRARIAIHLFAQDPRAPNLPPALLREMNSQSTAERPKNE
jgi:hypothetical protein